MFEPLLDALATLKERIGHHREEIGPYELRTRCCLVDPLLRALGWDPSDPSIVRVESQVGETTRRVDYALLDDNRRPVVYIEAKKLSDRAPAIAQAVGYVWEENQRRQSDVRYFVWTNGDAWKAWDIRNSSGNPLISAAVTDENPSKTALRLAGLWRPSIVDRVFEPATKIETSETATQSKPEDADEGAHSTRPAKPRSVKWRVQNPKRQPNGNKLSSETQEALVADIKDLHIDQRVATQVQVASHYGVSPGTVAMYVKQIRDGKR